MADFSRLAGSIDAELTEIEARQRAILVESQKVVEAAEAERDASLEECARLRERLAIQNRMLGTQGEEYKERIRERDNALGKLAEIDTLAADMEKSKEPGEQAHGMLILDITRERHHAYCSTTIARDPGPCDCGLVERLACGYPKVTA